MNGAVFLDRDGVIIENREDYVKSWADVTYVPGALEAIRQLTEAGWPVIMVTNQSAVGRGIITIPFLEWLHNRMLAEIEAAGGSVLAVYYCPHRPDGECTCRKPRPGMLQQAALDHNINLASSYIVGDALSDIAAGRAVGTRGVLVKTGRGAAQAQLLDSTANTDFPIVDDLTAAVHTIIAGQSG